MTEMKSNRVVHCDRCDRAIVGGTYVVDCSGATTRRYCRGCVPDARKVPTAEAP